MLKNKMLKKYKQTEIGVIPDDWEIDTIDNLASVTTGDKNTQDRITDGEYPFFVRSPNIERINSYVFDGEAVLTAGDGVGTGKIFHYINGKFDFHQRVYKISDFCERLNGYFFYLYFSNNFYNRIMQMTAKSSVDSVRREMIAEMKIPLPLPEEQSAISSALDDVGSLIKVFEKLLAKKRAIKQGAMQELLTGKRRLPGFSGKWEMSRLGDLLDYERPDKYIVKDTEYVERGQIPVLTANKSFILGYTNEDFGICKKLPVIIFDDFTTDSKYVDFSFKIKSSAIKILKNRSDSTNLKYIYERMKLIDFPLGDHKRYYISEYQNIMIPVPKSDEQFAIVQVINDFDFGIEALKQNLAKYRLLKQGMTQVLLTGKVRLI